MGIWYKLCVLACVACSLSVFVQSAKAPRARCRRMAAAKKAMKTKAMKAAETKAMKAAEAGALQFRTSRFRYVPGFQQVNVGGGINWIYIKVPIDATPIELWTGYHGKEYRCVVGGQATEAEAGAPPAGWTLQPSADTASSAKKAMTMKTKAKMAMTMKTKKAMMAKKAMKAKKAIKTKAMKSKE